MVQRRIATTLAYYRKQAGVNQDKLANALGVSQTIVSQWEAGTRPIPDVRLKGIASALGCEAEALSSPIPITPGRPKLRRRRREEMEPVDERNAYIQTLAYYRTQPRWSQEQLVDATGLALASLRRMEAGEEAVDFHTAEILGRALGIEPEEVESTQLVGRYGHPTPTLLEGTFDKRGQPIRRFRKCEYQQILDELGIDATLRQALSRQNITPVD